MERVSAEPVALSLLREDATEPEADLERSLTLLRSVARGEMGPLLRLYAPAPTLAFGRRDTRLPGYDEAVDAAAAAGFTPVVRSAGGRATAYHRGTLVVDHIQPEAQAVARQQARFAEFGELFATALSSLGVDAAVGELPGEYCPGEFSVHGRPLRAAGGTGAGVVGASGNGTRAVKLVGTAQRVVAGAWLFSSVVMVADTAPLRSVTTDVYAALGLELDPGTVGTLEDLLPSGRAPGMAQVEDALLDTWTAAGYLLER